MSAPDLRPLMGETAPDAHARWCAAFEQRLDEGQRLLDLRRALLVGDAIHWGHVGDMQHAVAELDDVLLSFGGVGR